MYYIYTSFREHIIVYFCVLFLHNVDPCFAKIQQHRFQRRTFCNATTPPSKVVSWPVSSLQCAVQCSVNISCFAYAFGGPEVCKMYPRTILDTVRCSPRKPGAINVFKKVLRRKCQNNGQLDMNNKCVCLLGYSGGSCEKILADCKEGYERGYRTDQMYWIKPVRAPEAFKVSCQMSTGSGYTRIQTRLVGTASFNKTWVEYKNGFVVVEGTDFWLGNDRIHWLTSSSPQQLIVQLSNSTHNFQHIYFYFVMADEAENYAVRYSSSWSPPDPNKNMGACWPGSMINFSTYDNDNDGSPDNCASLYGAGFWFQSSNCSMCNPNGNTHYGQSTRLHIPSENFWIPILGDWTPDVVGMVLTRI